MRRDALEEARLTDDRCIARRVKIWKCLFCHEAAMAKPLAEAGNIRLRRS